MTRILRKYRCMDCGHKFTRTYPVGSSIDDPPCPVCANVPPPTPERIAAPAITTTKSKAVDKAWEIAQEDFGLTNMRDNAQEGETAYIPPTAPPSAPTNPGFLWGGASSNHAALPAPQQLMTNGKGAAALARAEGRGPMELLHKARPKLQAVPLNKG